MKWIQRQTGESMDDEALRDYLRESHRLVVLKLPRLIRAEIGLRRVGRQRRIRRQGRHRRPFSCPVHVGIQ